MRNSFELTTYEPLDSAFWADKLGQYKGLARTSRN